MSELKYVGTNNDKKDLLCLDSTNNTCLTDQYLTDCYSAKTILKFIDASRGFDHQLAYWTAVWLNENPVYHRYTGSVYSDENIMFMMKCIEEIKSGNVTSEEAKLLKWRAELCTWRNTQ